MFDGTFEIFERVWRMPTVEIIAVVGDKIIIEYQSQPDRKDMINLPSGRADKSDDVMQEAKRELLEETGYESKDWTLFLKHEGDGKVLHEVHYFIARDCKKIQEAQLDAGEKIETKLITFDEFLLLTEKPRFWMPSVFIAYLLRLQLDLAKKEEFYKTLFG